MAEGSRDFFGVSFITALNLLIRLCPQKLKFYLQISSHWELGFNILILGGHRRSDHSISLRRDLQHAGSKTDSMPEKKAFTAVIRDYSTALSIIYRTSMQKNQDTHKRSQKHCNLLDLIYTSLSALPSNRRIHIVPIHTWSLHQYRPQTDKFKKP